MISFRLAIALFTIFFFTLGCSSNDNPGSFKGEESNGLSSSDESSSSEDEVLGFELIDFKVLGSDRLVGGHTTENPTTDEGEFGLTWTVMGSKGSYFASIYASTDDVIGSDDIIIYSVSCDLEMQSCSQGQFQTTSCVFHNSNEVACESDLEALTDISPLLDELPKDLHLIVEICEDSSPFYCSVLVRDLTFL